MVLTVVTVEMVKEKVTISMYFVTITCLLCYCITQVCRAIHRLIADYRDQRRGPSLVLLQSPWGGADAL